MGPKVKISAGSAFLTGMRQPAILGLLSCEADNLDNKFLRLLRISNQNGCLHMLG